MSLSNAAAKLADDMLGKRDVAQHSTQPDVSGRDTMKAIVWKGAKHVACEDKPVPRVTHPQDVVVRVTQASVCSGSDSHLYSGEVVTMDDGLILGHEACGVVHQVGLDVTKFKPGDRVVIAFDIACGTCARCVKQEFSGCDRTNDSRLFEEMYGGPAPAAIYGYSRLMGNVPGSQAEFVRVPFADVNLCAIPDDVSDEQALFVSDVLPTALHAVEMGCVRAGDVVAIWGLGPIGLYAAAWARLKGAARVIGVDLVAERLRLARDKFGIEVMDRSDLSSAQVMSQLRNLLPQGGVDVAIDATGFRYAQSWTHSVERALGMETDTPDILTECMTLVRKFGHVSVIADYLGYANHFPVGHIMMKHLTVRSGQCPVQKYFKYVMENVQNGAIDPLLMVTHRLPLEDVPRAYEQLFYKKNGCIKVLVVVAGREELLLQQQQQQHGMDVGLGMSSPRMSAGVGEKVQHMSEKMESYGREMQGQQHGEENLGGETHVYGQEQQQQQQQEQQQQERNLQHHFHPQPQQHKTHETQQTKTQQQQEQEEQEEEENPEKQPSMLTRAMQALKMTGPSNTSEPESEQQEHQQKQQPQHGRRLDSDEPTHTGQLDIP